MAMEYGYLGYAYLKADGIDNRHSIREAGKQLARFFLLKAISIADTKGLYVNIVDEAEPYADGDAMRDDIRDNNRLLVANTIPGTTPLWSPSANNAMRLWHDYTHHYEHGLGFDMDSEFEAYKLAVSEFKEWASSERAIDDYLERACVAVLFSEMVLQPSAATWLGGYDRERGGLSFVQKIVDLGYYGI